MNVLIDDPEIAGYDFTLLTVNDFLDSRKTDLLKHYNAQFNELTLEEAKEMIILQSQLLDQLGIYDSLETKSPSLGYLRKKQKSGTPIKKSKPPHPHGKSHK